MFDHIAKPIDPDELWSKLRRWMRPGRRPAAEPMAAAAVAPTSAPVPAETGTADPRRLFAGVAGLDVATGLRQALGRERLYLSLMHKFVVTQGDFRARLQAALEAGDLQAAQIHAHTLKGVAGQIGATALREAAFALETALRERQAAEAIHARLDDLTPGLDALLEAVRARLPDTPASAPATAVDVVALREACARLEALLAADDFGASGALDEHRALLQAAMGPAFNRLAGAIENFAFEEGLAALRAWMGTQDWPA